MDITQPPFCHLQQLYEFEFSEVTRAQVDESGVYRQKDLLKSWSPSGFDIYLFYYNRLLIGFCVVNLSSMIDYDERIRDVAEFFVMPLFRKSGVGRYFAQKIFGFYQSPWEVRQLSQLQYARSFWVSVIRDYTGNTFQETHMNSDQWKGYLQRFNSPGGEKV